MLFSANKSAPMYCDENLPEIPKPLPMMDENMTIRVPSMEAFAEMARASSTPFHGRVFVPDDDENTCNVEIIFKRPEPVQDPAVPVQEPVQEPASDKEHVPVQPTPLSPIMETSRENWKSSSSRYAKTNSPKEQINF